jgi:hypothetical protein
MGRVSSATRGYRRLGETTTQLPGNRLVFKMWPHAPSWHFGAANEANVIQPATCTGVLRVAG